MGNVADQVKFSELTLDMFRMLQTLEREPQDELAQVGAPYYGPGDTTGDQGNMDRLGIPGISPQCHKYHADLKMSLSKPSGMV